MTHPGKMLVWLHGEVKLPPFTSQARVRAGVLLRRLQGGEVIGMPESRAMGTIGAGCHELRIRDGGREWRIIYLIEPDAVIIVEVFQKKSQQTPKHIVETC